MAMLDTALWPAVEIALLERLETIPTSGDPTVITQLLGLADPLTKVGGIRAFGALLDRAESIHYDDLADALWTSLTKIAERCAATEVETALLSQLDEGGTAHRARVATALGERAGLPAVAPLLKVSKGFFVNGALAEACKAAIAAIQDRAGSADRGGLSIASTQGGELSSPE